MARTAPRIWAGTACCWRRRGRCPASRSRWTGLQPTPKQRPPDRCQQLEGDQSIAQSKAKHHREHHTSRQAETPALLARGASPLTPGPAGFPPSLRIFSRGRGGRPGGALPLFPGQGPAARPGQGWGRVPPRPGGDPAPSGAGLHTEDFPARGVVLQNEKDRPAAAPSGGVRLTATILPRGRARGNEQ